VTLQASEVTVPGLVRIRTLSAFSAGGAWYEGGSAFLVDTARALELREAGLPLEDAVDFNTTEPVGQADRALLEAAFAPVVVSEAEVPQPENVFADEGEG
jgi:hypothetical protein